MSATLGLCYQIQKRRASTTLKLSWEISLKARRKRGQMVGPKNSEVERGKTTFWTVCPYCFYLHEYEKVYEECCLRCQNCKRGFHGLTVAAPPDTMVVGSNGYYCGYGVFPLGFSFDDYLGKKKADGGGTENEKRDDFVVISDDEMEMDVQGGGFSGQRRGREAELGGEKGEICGEEYQEKDGEGTEEG